MSQAADLSLKKILKGHWMWIISITLDPFIWYVPSIQDEEKLLTTNSSLLICFSVLCLSLLIYRIYISYRKKKSKWRVILYQAEPITLLYSIVIYLLVLIPKREIRAPIFAVVLGIFLVVYSVKIFGIYRLFTEEVTRCNSCKLAEAVIFKIVLNLLLFSYGGHIFGGLWYLFAVWKKLECWRKACSKHDGCHYRDYRFTVSLGDNQFLNEICFAKIEDTNKPYELGIFKDALESHIVETKTQLWKKLLYSFRWGIQNISGFGQNLQVSTYAWENIFVIALAIYGVGTFTFFIGNMQNLIKSTIDQRTEEKRKKEHQAIEQLVLFGKRDENLQNIIKENQQYNYHQTGVVDVQNLFIPKDVEIKIKRELIKKVERFRKWSDASLDRLCDCLEPIVYDELTCIVREGDPIDEMLFVLHGRLWNFSSVASSTNNVSSRDRRKEILKDGDFWGEELVNWVEGESSSSSLSSKILISLHLKGKKKLISHTTIKALTKVEAFVLRIDDWKKLFNEKAKILQSWFRKRKKRLYGLVECNQV